MRERLTGLCLFFMLPLLLLLSPCGASAQEMYLVSPAELNLLETNLTKLESINKQQQTQLKEQKGLLNQARFDLEELQYALKTSKEETAAAQSSLANANKLLSEYAQEERKKLNKVKCQRTIGYVVAAGLLYGYVKEKTK